MTMPQKDWDDRTRRIFVRSMVTLIETGGSEACPVVTAALLAAGFKADEWVGDPCKSEAKTVQWYAGQLLSIMVSGKPWMMNSMLNCLDEFVPDVV